jgi:hypothetical protein
MTLVISVIGLLALLAALAGALLLDAVREVDEVGIRQVAGRPAGLVAGVLAGAATDRRGLFVLVVGLAGLGAVCTAFRLVGLA